MVEKATLVSVRLKLSAAFLAASLIIAGFVIGAVRMQLDAIESAALLEAEHFANVVAYASTDDALLKPEFLQRYVDGLHALQGRDLVFVDVGKKGIADVDKPDIGVVFHEDNGNEVGQTIRDGRVRTFIERSLQYPKGIKQIVVPLRASRANIGSPIVGAAIVEYTDIYDRLRVANQKNLYLLGAFGIACMLLIMIVGLTIAARMAGRIKGLQEAADILADGNYEAKVAITSRDELGRLGRAFNTMADALKGNRDELLEYGRKLEDRVKSRTEELTHSNTQLRVEAEERAKAVSSILRLNRVYAVLSGINTLIVRVRDRDELFKEACRISVEAGEFVAADILILDPGSARETLVASHYVDARSGAALRAFLDDASPQARKFRERIYEQGEPLVFNDLDRDLLPELLGRDRVATARAVCALPLMIEGRTIGALLLRAREAGFFDAEEVKLLTELAGDIAFAVDTIEKRERLDYLAYYDQLTGLANRHLFLERMAQYKRSAAAAGHKLAVMLIDLERFKSINDSLGRAAGDTLLKAVADWLTRNVGGAELLARLDADHFALIVPEVRQRDDLSRLIESKRQALLDHPFRLSEDSLLRVSVKAGVAVFPDDGTDADTLLRNAEAALKQAKRRGDRYLFHAQDMTAATAGKLTLENQLRLALERDEFVLHYQPKVSLTTGKLTSAEALIRWNDLRTGLVPPGRFIPVLEETGLIHEVGRWALKKAVDDYLRWRTAGLPAVRIAVNVSSVQLRSRSFVDEVGRVIGIDGRAAGGLELEITESLIMEDVGHNIESLHALRALGITIAIDDFGTGFSSLAYLAKLPVDTIKIDRSFVTDMISGPQGLALVQTIIKLGHSLNLKVVAEGVETEEQSRLLRLMSCDEMQGFLFSKPLPADVFETKFLSQPSADIEGGASALI